MARATPASSATSCPPPRARALQRFLERARAVVARLDALAAYHRAVLAHEENGANVMIDEYEEATRRIAKLALPPRRTRTFASTWPPAARGSHAAGRKQRPFGGPQRPAPRREGPADGAAKPDLPRVTAHPSANTSSAAVAPTQRSSHSARRSGSGSATTLARCRSESATP